MRLVPAKPQTKGGDKLKYIAIDIMLSNNIRHIGIKSDNAIKIINDRQIMEYLFFIQRLRKDILQTKVDYLDAQKIGDISPTTTISNAAAELISNPPACSIEGSYIITPYDIVNKVLLSQICTN